MAHFGLKIKKSETPDKTPYTIYYPHTITVTQRNWTQPYYQVISIDPAAKKNYALRVERRYHNGWITPVVYDKTAIYEVKQEGETTISNTYEVLTAFLNKYQQFYEDCHFIIIERQLPQNYQATRVAQHTITYFSLRLHNKPLLPGIVEIDPKLKGKMLGAPKGINEKQLKSWAIVKARELLTIRQDKFSLEVLDHFRNKQDDLSDTVVQIEAVFICWGLPPTGPPPIAGPDDTPQPVKAITLQLMPPLVFTGLADDLPVPIIQPVSIIQPLPNQAPIPAVNLKLVPVRQPAQPIRLTQPVAPMLTLLTTAPVRLPAQPVTLNPIPLPQKTLKLQIGHKDNTGK